MTLQINADDWQAKKERTIYQLACGFRRIADS